MKAGIGEFINRFKGDIDLSLGISALIKDYGIDEIVNRFKGIESKLSPDQKKAVNHAFKENWYDAVYVLD